MNPTAILQAVGFNFDFATLPGTIILIVVSAIVVAMAFLAIYWAYSTIGASVDAKVQADAAAQRTAAIKEVQDMVAAGKQDLLDDFASLIDMDKAMREKLTLATIEERALAKATSTG